MLGKLIQSIVLISIPTLISIIGISIGSKIAKLNIILSIIVAILLIYTDICLVFAGTVDPGIIPGRELQEYYLDKLWKIITDKQKLLYQQKTPQSSNKQLLLQKPSSTKFISAQTNIAGYIEQDPRCQFKKSRCYQIINSNHMSETPLTYSVKGFKFNAKFCPTCRFYRPLRSSHSSKSNACMQRYDHFCIWLGTDVCLHNHWLFYLMMLGVLVTCTLASAFDLLSFILDIVSLTQKDVTQKGQLIASTVITLICCPVQAYIVYSIMDLIKYHYQLCKTASLTKEDNGGNNYNISTPFSKMNTFKNMMLAFNGAKQERILHKFIVEQEQLIKLASKNQFVTSFDALGRILKMNQIYGFDNLIVQNEQLGGQAKQKSSMRFSVMAVEEDTSKIKQQEIAANIKFNEVITARDAFEYAILRSHNMVLMTFDNFITLKKQNPEMFKENENVGTGPKGNDTALMRCAARLSGKKPSNDKAKQTELKPQTVQTQELNKQANNKLQMKARSPQSMI